MAKHIDNTGSGYVLVEAVAATQQYDVEVACCEGKDEIVGSIAIVSKHKPPQTQITDCPVDVLNGEKPLSTM